MATPQGREAYDLAATGTGFTIGPVMAAHAVYVFFDPTCPHCAALWMASKPLLGRLKMVWMPIGLLNRSSMNIGATILASPDPAVAMLQNETSVLEQHGGIPVNPNVGEGIVAKVKANTDLFDKLGAESVPFILYQNAKTGVFGSYAGQLETDQLAALVGV